MTDDDRLYCSPAKAAYYAKVIHVIAFQLKVDDAVPPFLTVPPPPDDLEYGEDEMKLILEDWLGRKFGAPRLEIRLEAETVQ
jgi:hypothetical protein